MKRIYLDHNATTPLHPEVKQAIIDSLDIFGNASSIHPFGIETREKIEAVRSDLMAFLGASSGKVIFTSGGSESNNVVLKSHIRQQTTCCGQANVDQPHVITTAIEHPSILNTVQCLRNLGADVTQVAVDRYGKVDPQDVIDTIRPNTILVSIMLANNEVGTIQPVEVIGRVLKEKGIVFHCDAVQAVGKIPVNVEDLNVDYLSISGHKINATKGIGALYLGSNLSLCPLIHGGHQELDFRAGTENTLGIIALGKAIEIAREHGPIEAERVRNLRDRFHRILVENLDGVYLNGHPEDRLPGTLNLSFDHVDGAAIVEMAGAMGVAASSGSACSSRETTPSHVLSAMGLPAVRLRSAVRFSFGYGNAEADIEEAAGRIVTIITRLRAISPIRSGSEFSQAGSGSEIKERSN
ncbi:cysteine desulfurase [bacterium]|nr:cysteine desulfurase [candidate division CSSED10-310 bacterium]